MPGAFGPNSVTTIGSAGLRKNQSSRHVVESLLSYGYRWVVYAMLRPMMRRVPTPDSE